MLDLPHLAGVATRGEPDVVARIMAEVSALLDDRERFFKANRIDLLQTYRHERAAGRLDDGYGDVFLIIDGWSTLKTDFEDISTRIMTIVPRALARGANDACRAIAEAWTGPQGPKLRLLPTRIDLATLQEQVPPGGAPVIGINEARLEPVRLDMSHDPHFIVLGDAKTGRRRQSRHVRTDHPDAERLVDTRHHAALKSRRGAAARAAETHPRASGTSAPHQPRPRGPVAPARLGAPTQ